MKAPLTAEPIQDSLTCVSLNIAGNESSKFRIVLSLSLRFTKMSSGRGRKISSRSETTNICGWLKLAFKL
jgi:hypothetical protein